MIIFLQIVQWGHIVCKVILYVGKCGNFINMNTKMKVMCCFLKKQLF